MLKNYYSDWIGPNDLTYHVSSGDEPFIWHVPSDNAEAEWISRIARQAITERKNVLVLVPKKEFFPLISSTLQRYGIPHECPVNLLPKSVNDRLSTISNIFKWLEKPEDSFLTRLAIESLMNHGIAKVLGADKSQRCSQQTIKKRIEIETEVAELWEDVNKRKSLFTTVNEKSKPTTELENIRKTLSNLLELYRNTGQKYQGELAKQLSLSIGGWAESKKLVSDLLMIIKLLEPTESTGFGTVQLMTMRKAKGLEADVVIIAGLEDDIVPNPISDIAEEARLFYVSMTRAKEKLYLLHAFKRLRSISYGPEITRKRRSRFIDSIGRDSIYKS
jgi:superfamily I DNA/RNA helicase